MDAWHTDRFWRRRSPRPCDAGRRTTRRSGRHPGTPFVGPAGKLLDKVLEQVGIDRNETYVTNAVKHFKWEPRGKRRIHKKPNAIEITACKPWIEAEIEVLHPQVIVCLGATAAQALLGREFKVSTQRGVWVPSPLAPYVMATLH